MIKMFKIWLSVFVFFIPIFSAYAQNINIRKLICDHETGATLAPGLYKAYYNSYVNLNQKSSTPIFNVKRESAIYRWLLIKILQPKHIVLQATVYPVALISSYLETFHPKAFNKFEFRSWNFLRSLGTSPEEPYAFSILFGNFAFLGSCQMKGNKKIIKQSGSAMAGFLFSISTKTILDNIQINDRWWQVEYIMTGLMNDVRLRKLKWNFRVGVKFHQNNLVQDVFLISIYRNNTEWTDSRFTFFKNSRIQYEMQFPIGSNWLQNKLYVRQLITYGKKIPFKLWNKFFAFRLGGGILWENVRKYDHVKNEFKSYNSRQLIWLIQPGIEF